LKNLNGRPRHALLRSTGEQAMEEVARPTADLSTGRATIRSESLRPLYEQRAVLEYAAPVPLPDPRVDRKFERVVALITSTLPAESLLDAGCGDGRFLAAVARSSLRPPQLVGIDISERILETAEKMVALESADAQFVRANLEQLPFASATFERILCVQVVEHLLDPSAGVKELVRVLRCGGRLVVSTDSADSRVSQFLNFPRTVLVRAFGLAGRRAKVTFPHGSFRRDEFVSLIRGAGLEVEAIETFKFHIDGLDVAPIKRLLNVLDRAMAPHTLGDIVLIVARKPA
jgi:2-polyprenyl-3-methyl-5-hydroxy-6-metoxy-1,4-benzoquinol methylase